MLECIYNSQFSFFELVQSNLNQSRSSKGLSIFKYLFLYFFEMVSIYFLTFLAENHRIVLIVRMLLVIHLLLQHQTFIPS